MEAIPEKQSEYFQHVTEIGDIIESVRRQNARLMISAVRYLGSEQSPDNDDESIFGMPMPEEAEINITETEDDRYSLFSIPVDCISKFRLYEPGSKNSPLPDFSGIDLIIQAPHSVRLARLYLVLDGNTKIAIVEDKANSDQA